MPTVVSIPLVVSSVDTPDQWSLPGGATYSKVQAVTDNSDTTLINNNFDNGLSQRFNLGAPFISPVISEIDGSITSIDVTIRARAVTHTGYWVKLGVGSSFTDEQPHFPPYSVDSFGQITNPFESFTLSFTTRPGGGAWTFSDLLALKINLRSILANRSLSISSVGVTAVGSINSFLNTPTGLTIVDDDYNFVELEWDDNSTVESGYEIQRSKNSAPWETIAIIAANSTSYKDQTVRSITPYEYAVRAIHSSDANLVSPFSSIVSLTTNPPSGPPTAPNNLVVLGRTPTTLPLTWFVDNDLANTYEVQRSADGGSTWFETVVVDAPAQTHTFEVLPGSTYTFRVRGVNSVGTSAYSSTITESAPEESFRNFLENEVLQDTARYLGWYDRVNTNPHLFEVTQTIGFASDITIAPLPDLAQQGRRSVAFFRSQNGEVLIDQLRPLIQATGGVEWSFDAVLYALYGNDLIGFAEVPPYTTKVKLDSPLTMDVPKGTVFWTAPNGLLRFLVGNDDIIRAKSADDEEYFDESSVIGAKVGETLIEVDYQTRANIVDAWGATKEGYPMGAQVSDGSLSDRSYQVGTIVRGTFEVTLPVDHTTEPFDASPIYDTITTEALLRIGYVNEADVPASDYQQFRDAGRVEAWRAVTYATLHKQDMLVDNTFKYLSEIHRFAAQQLAISEAEYQARYSEPVVIVSSVRKPRASSYSKSVVVNF